MTLTEVRSRYSAAAGCDALYEVSDPRLGLVGFIALHDLASGPGVGGIRRWAYASAREAVADAVRLAEQMTLKTALAGLPAGGAKAVLLDRPGLDVAAAYGALGEAIEALGGQYFSGADLGTGEEELRFVRAHTGHVNFIDNDQAGATATGVLAAVDAALAHLGQSAAGQAALVQGLGAVGGLVARGWAERGGALWASEPRPERLASLRAAHPGARTWPVGDVGADVALLAPCASGAVVSAENVASLRCRVICGSANVQLETPCLAEALAEAGILYVPDFAANAGAAIEGVLTRVYGATEEVRARVAREVASIGDRVASILAEAAESGWTPLEVALARVDRPRPACGP